MFVCCVCCQVEVSATSWSLVQRSPTDCGVSCVIKKCRGQGDYSLCGAAVPEKIYNNNCVTFQNKQSIQSPHLVSYLAGTARHLLFAKLCSQKKCLHCVNYGNGLVWRDKTATRIKV
jgi:hypothetical protein